MSQLNGDSTPKAWRDDFKNSDQPTVSTIVQCAMDPVHPDVGYFGLEIWHVKDFHGKGFMPHVLFTLGGGSMVANGKVHRDFYAAVIEGMTLQIKFARASDEQMEATRKRTAEWEAEKKAEAKAAFWNKVFFWRKW
jgi:hypothetical protein